MPQKDSAEKAVRDIRRKTRRKFSAEGALDRHRVVRICSHPAKGIQPKPPVLVAARSELDWARSGKRNPCS
jgi:hypothetical protein